MKNLIKSYLNSFPFLYHVRYGLTNYKGGLAPRVCLKLFPEVIQIKFGEIERILELLNIRGNVKFVQIGSNDGKSGDPLYKYISTTDTWQGVLVEPINSLFQLLQQTYANRTSLRFENSLISDKYIEKDFYYISSEAKEVFPDLPDWYSQLGSVNKKHILKHFDAKILPYIKQETLTSITLNELFSKYSIKNLDLLHIDTEGHDYQIVKQLDFTKIYPLVILVEYKHLTYWETFNLVKKLRTRYKLCVTTDDLLAVEYKFAQQVELHSPFKLYIT